MSDLRFHAIPTADARLIWEGGPDAYGLQPEPFLSDGDGNPCRHCLRMIDEGEAALLLAYRPFPASQAFAETGPIFLHSSPCERYASEEGLPPIIYSPDYIVRGYSRDDRIVYGTGAITPKDAIDAYAESLLRRAEVAYVHIRSARNNCYHCRVELDLSSAQT